MIKTVNIHEAKTHLSALLADVQRGDEIVLAKSGKPIAKIIPFPSINAKRQPGRLKGQIKLDPTFWEALPDTELSAWEGHYDIPDA
jgi:prevent-host-death family protein